MRSKQLGDLELEILQYVSEHPHCSVRDVADGFGEPKGLARTTILTVMERLRKKGFVKRQKRGGAYAYSAAQDQGEVIHGLVSDFIAQKLGGSLSPFVAYLAKSKGLTKDEIANLRALVDDLEEGGEK